MGSGDSVVFPEGKLPAIDPADPAFVLVLGGLEIQGTHVLSRGTGTISKWANGKTRVPKVAKRRIKELSLTTAR